MNESSAAEKLAEHRPCEGQRIQGGVYSGRCALHLAYLPQHCLKCWEPSPCDVSALTTRLAEAQEKLDCGSRRPRNCSHTEPCREHWKDMHAAVQSMVAREVDRAVAAETRLAEVERERDEAVKNRDMEWWEALVLVDNVAPTPEAAKDWLLCLSAHERESDEQLLSEMAEGLRKDGHGLDPECCEGVCPMSYRNQSDCDRCVLLAKYDARKGGEKSG